MQLEKKLNAALAKVRMKARIEAQVIISLKAWHVWVTGLLYVRHCKNL